MVIYYTEKIFNLNAYCTKISLDNNIHFIILASQLLDSELIKRDACGVGWNQPVQDLNLSKPSCYKFLLLPTRSWYDAKRDCAEENATLLDLETLSEVQWVKTITGNPNVTDI